MEHLLHPERFAKHVVSAPFIFSVFIPVVIADLWIEIYHRICFELYGIEYVERSKYVKIDRQKLSYLNPLQKVFCVYCGYVNGVFAYWVEIAARTEKYWCGIQHKKDSGYALPEHQKDFVQYDNEREFIEAYSSEVEEEQPQQ